MFNSARYDDLHITVNARFLTHPMTGVQRYASELVKRMPPHTFNLVHPAQNGLKGHAWEQISLPSKCRGILWSPCNTGPLAVKEQVVTIHDTAFIDCPQNFSWIFRKWYKILIPRLARRVKHVLTVSEFSKQRIVELTGICSDKVTVIPNGVSTELAPVSDDRSRLVLKKYGLEQDYVLTLGSISDRKNLRGLLKAWDLVSKKVDRIELVVAGGNFDIFGGNQFDIPKERVRFLGRVEDSELAALYSAATAFVFPSLYEGFGIPPLEAMACGCPVVCSNATAIPEAVGEAALLFDPKQTSEIADCLQRVLADQMLRERLVAAGFAQSRQASWDRATEKFLDAMCRIANR